MSKAGITRRTIVGGIAAAPFVANVTRAYAQTRTVRIWTFLDPASTTDPRARVYKKLIDSFEAKNPGVKISVEPQNWTQMTDKFFVAHQAGIAPDIMWVYRPKLDPAVDMGALANLDELFAKNKLMTKEDYDDLGGPYHEWGSRKGAHYQITHSRSLVGIINHSDQLKGIGVDPSAILTWDQFLDAAKKLTQTDATGKVTRWGFGQVFTTTANLPGIAASVMMDKDGTLFHPNGKARFATPAGIEGMTLAVDLVRKHKVCSIESISLNGEDNFDVFTSGRASMILSSSARIPRLRGIIKSDEVEFMPIPGFTKGKASPTEASGWPIGVWSGSKLKDEAAAFLAHTSTQEADKMWVLEGGAIPIRKSTITQNQDFFGKPINKYLVSIADVMNRFVWFTPNQPAGGYNEELDKAGQAILGRNVDVKAALETAEANFNRANGFS